MFGIENVHSSIEFSDFMFENSLVTVVAVKSTPKIELIGFSVGPFEEGHEYEVRLWVARELERDGIVRIREGALDAAKLYKIQWTERIQAVGQLSTLPEDFYPRLRRLIDELRAASRTSPEKMREYEYVQNLAQDIVNCRLRKIISLASIPAPESQVLKNLTPEERALYERIHQIVSEWRSKIV
ncbi:MAG: hypothetical protein QW502_04980 [Candidatus Bathyarchaeia archaeon]|nr:DNA replication complex GINS family protein [Candidatus Bathyarchaeota archaeon]